MKKVYVKPSVEVIKVNATNMLAASVRMIDDTVDTSEDNVQLGRKNNSSFGNIWDSQW